MFAGGVAVGSTSTGHPPDGVPTKPRQPALQEFGSGPTVRRTIHYLGSKLRLVPPIRRAIASVAPEGDPICDLFSGSGVVSLALAPDWNVTSVDIQEYSRVLCNGLVAPPADAPSTAERLCHRAAGGSFGRRLRQSLLDLLSHERNCIAGASQGEVGGLCDLLEHGSLLALDTRDEIPLTLRDAARASLNELHNQGLASGAGTVVTRHFGGRYFSWEQAIDFDTLLAEIHLLDGRARDFHLSALFAAASDVVSTIGKHFAQPTKLRDSAGDPKEHLVSRTVRDRKTSVPKLYRAYCQSLSERGRASRPHRAVRSDYMEFLKNDSTRFAAVYADPPYTRDHYSRYYHVLETMALRDEPAVATTKIRSGGVPRLSRGVYRLHRHQSPFCIPSKAVGAFDQLLSCVAQRRTPLVLSYSPYRASTGNRPRLLTMDELFAIARRHFAEVESIPIDGVVHNKLNVVNRNVEVDYIAEVLISCRP